jgi:hypothetical protein
MRNPDFVGVSPSQLEASTCRMAWHLGYRLGYRAKRVTASLDLGTGVHAALEALYAEGRDPVGVFTQWCKKRRAELAPEWEDDLNAMAEVEGLGTTMLEGYVEQWAEADKSLEVIATEHTLEGRVPIPGTEEPSRYTIRARLDGVVRDVVTGKLFSLEHKTFSRSNPAFHDLNHQFTAQVWLGRDLVASLGMDDPVIGVLYNGLRKQAPGPRVKGPLFVREKIYRNENQIAVMLYRAYWVCEELYSADVKIYPSPSPVRCGSCEFREVCVAWQRGEDYQFLLDEGFSGREERNG